MPDIAFFFFFLKRTWTKFKTCKNTGRVEFQPQNSSLLENNCGKFFMAEKWKSLQIFSPSLGHRVHFSGMRNTWVSLRDSRVGFGNEASVLTLSSSYFKLSGFWEGAGLSIFVSVRGNRACRERQGRPLSGDCILDGEPLRFKHQFIAMSLCVLHRISLWPPSLCSRKICCVSSWALKSSS